FGEHTVQIGGLVVLTIGLALLPFAVSLGVLLLALAILSIGEGAVTPTTNALLSLATPADAQGETLGLAQGMAGLGRVIGPLVAGWLFGIGIGLPFIFGALLTLAALLIALPRVAVTSWASPKEERETAAASANPKAEQDTVATSAK
ncbi:MAG TPA: MFS transporter, partial [Pyrinomonadaceae bacterium]